MPTIGTLGEGPLHAGLKRLYASPGCQTEVLIDGLIIDVVDDDLLIEIQTAGFSPLAPKLERLLPTHRVRVVHPIAEETVIVKVSEDGEILSRRRSPKRGRVVDIFTRLVSITGVLTDPNLEIDVVSTVEEQVRRHEPGKAWRRRGWVIDHRRLVEVRETTPLRSPTDLAELLPVGLPDEFTTADIAAELDTPTRTAQQMAYCLRSIGAITQVGTSGRAHLYRRAPV